MNIKKIFKSLDLRNNKLINAKTNLPTHEDHVISRKYVDNQTIYNTSKVNQYLTPFKLDWVTAPVNKTILQIFDDIFFPLVNPVYTNPLFEYFTVEQIQKPGKSIVFENITNNFKITWKIIANDRLSTQVGRIIITKNDTSTTTINTSSTNLIGEHEFSIDFTNIQKIEFVRVFNPTTVSKNDSYGNPYTPADFQVLYNLKFDILETIKKQSLIASTILYRKVLTSENVEILKTSTLNINNIAQLISDMSYIKSTNSINVLAGNDNFFLLLMPKEIINFYLILFDGVITPIASITPATNDTIINDKEYILYTIDLGYYPANQIKNIKFH